MSKYTPGPWATTREGNGILVYLEDEGSIGYAIARTFGNGQLDTANARLIASSPTMLGLLKTGVRAIADAGKDVPDSLRYWAERAQEIINHAEGA